MPMNPARVMSTTFRRSVLALMFSEESNGALVGSKAFLVTDIQVASLTNELSGVTLGTHGMQTGATLLPFSNPVVSQSGKVYSASSLLTFTAALPTGTETFKGVIISPTNNASDAFVYLEFDNPVTVDENGETVQLKIEIGFDGNKFYIEPRILPLGA